ncbi:MAG: glycosyltransferase [Coriobacteriia bacterium]|nr:glycosyltransferase [Coriobacteriia bacterium]
MRGWTRATFLFISTQNTLEPGGVEERWFAVMGELVSRGATVRLLAPLHTEVVDRARALGIQVDPYMLDKWNVVRTRSRLRKYLRRYQPSVVHSTGTEADVLLRWAARRVEGMRVAHTLRAVCTSGLRRTLGILAVRVAELGLSHAKLVFAETQELAELALSAGIPPAFVVFDPPAMDAAAVAESVAHHVDAYWRLLGD